MEPRVSFITLGVTDLARSLVYYRDILGLQPRSVKESVVFFELGQVWLALYPHDLLAEDAGVPDDGGGFRGITLAHNVRSPEEVDQLLATGAQGGGRLVKAGHKAFWGGYTGYFADPDGHLWEVAWNPHFPHV
ncbi:VOC family protein [Deefgea tanakiae]|uniref:VOC family protein n=1 Tax=Deefgea tanakiae TaxID=2865840 RepID=A0ABX8Z6J7_9NEIS|nr:VOC family protein [Deefgea tanakiae]QZA76534.1 VOC family protein [Deefgea tanakiae]